MEECEYHYCPRCAGIFLKRSKTLLECSSCLHKYYINARPCNAAILENESGHILLVRRKYPPCKDAWDLPGGFVSIGETIEESVIRELNEELGAIITNTVYFGSYADTYFFDGVLYHTVGLVFRGHIDNQPIQPKDDASEIRFFSKPDVLKQNIAFKSVKQALTDYMKFKTSFY